VPDADLATVNIVKMKPNSIDTGGHLTLRARWQAPLSHGPARFGVEGKPSDGGDAQKG
jgi:hypothetical protein